MTDSAFRISKNYCTRGVYYITMARIKLARNNYIIFRSVDMVLISRHLQVLGRNWRIMMKISEKCTNVEANICVAEKTVTSVVIIYIINIKLNLIFVKSVKEDFETIFVRNIRTRSYCILIKLVGIVYLKGLSSTVSYRNLISYTERTMDCIS